MEKVEYYLRIWIFMMDTSRKEKEMALLNTILVMEITTMDNLKTIKDMVDVSKKKLIMNIFKENIYVIKSRGKEN